MGIFSVIADPQSSSWLGWFGYPHDFGNLHIGCVYIYIYMYIRFIYDRLTIEEEEGVIVVEIVVEIVDKFKID